MSVAVWLGNAAPIRSVRWVDGALATAAKFGAATAIVAGDNGWVELAADRATRAGVACVAVKTELKLDYLGWAQIASSVVHELKLRSVIVDEASRPERFATDTAVFDHLKATGRENFHTALKEIDGIIGGNQWILGDQFSVVDGYALVFYGWGKRIGLPVEELKSYTAWKDRMLARPAVRRVLEREQNVLVAA